MTDVRTPAERPSLVRALGLSDVVLMSIVAVVGLRWIARGARAGAPSVTLWVLACVAFFLPLAAALAELASRHPEEGGLYVWTRRAFGPAHGFLCGWCMWVNNLFYFPSLLLFAAANALVAFGDAGARLADSHAYAVLFVLAGVWLCVGVNLVGLQTVKWLQNLGSLGTWIPAGVLIACGAVALVTFGSATSFAPAELVPRDDLLATLSLWSAMCFAFSGFEITSLVGREVRRPTRTIPLGVAIAGLLTTAIYLAGSASVLVAVPATALSERSGIADAVEVVSERVGFPGLGAATGLLLAIGAIAGTSSWTAGASRIPFAAGVDRALPHAFARLHPRHRTPYVALLVQGAATTSVFLLSVFLTVTGARSTIQEAYDILVNLTILIYFVPYLYLFAALVRLRPETETAEGVLRVPGGRLGLYGVAGAGLLATSFSVVLVFVPPVGTENVLNYEANLVLQAAAILGLGAWLHRAMRRRTADA